ncbi:unnamed protein product [Caenorhabditis auriculariae]|uniref:RING-type E3 ubiquitin transferase BRCA1 n=1 Tax=Caenorhabditis auriculariae TaxID=2777116 RepID=A0A8S1GYZ1_9PELO|nr:unnamed protein product [Caenorhabditis auriculariae]
MTSAENLALRINDVVSRLQRELRCGICCSTFKHPTVASCLHVFCKECLDECFRRQRKLFCPICRHVLDRRSCAESSQLAASVQQYLKLSVAFKLDVEKQTAFHVPPENKFAESQMPEQDVAKVPEPTFAVPAIPMRRKKLSAPLRSPAPEEVKRPKFDEPIPDKLPEAAKFSEKEVQTDKSSPIPEVPETIPSDPLLPCWRDFDLAELLQKYLVLKNQDEELDEIDALFELIPKSKPFLTKHIAKLATKTGRNGLFCRKFILLKPQEDDEIVEDSDPDDDDHTASHSRSVPRLSDFNNANESTVLAFCDNSQLLDMELEREPIVYSVSRLRNEEDHRLVEEFHAQFLSSNCRLEEEIGPHSTHLVMMNTEGRRCPQKSLMFAFAVARHCEIICRDWMDECLRTKTLLCPESYAITSSGAVFSSPDDEDIESQNEKGQGWEKSKTERSLLFKGLSFLILRRFAASDNLDYKKLAELTKLCGGTLLESSQPTVFETSFVVFGSYSTKEGEARLAESDYGCRVITAEWILDSICEYRLLPFEDYRVKAV